MQPGAPGGQQKTVMLQGSEGLISAAKQGGVPVAAPPTPLPGAPPMRSEPTGVVEQGASTLFWIVSLFIGVALGTLAYVIVLQL
jgi:hypothetical protein